MGWRTILECVDFRLWYTGKVCTRNSVGILIDKEWRSNVVEVKKIEDIIIYVRMIVGKETINIISTYAPQVGAKAHLKEEFWEDMEELVQGISLVEMIFSGRDLNGHVGKEAG
ncbi:hypothetical protein K1719_039833 [Acacia pycnantha]|nr:hypothetical protein K1719_039833 [Acacia pycnantha]